MSADDAFMKLKDYFESRPAAKTALGALREGVEIGLNIGGIVDCALYQKAGQPFVERRAAVNPDLVFNIRPESIDVLCGQLSDDIADIGIAVFKEILAGSIQINLVGSFLNFIRNGYLEIIKRGGARFSTYLATVGFTTFGKITAAIKKMRK